jgi:VCBS repeat-containing protein
VDADDPTFNGLRPGDVQTLSFAYDIVDEFGAAVARTATLILSGANDAPTLAGSLFRSIGENTGSATLDLLAGASDVDRGAVLRVENLRLSGGREGELPPGITLSADGRTLLVDSDHPAYADLGAGQTRTFSFTYDVADEFRARVAQTATVVINGADEPIGLRRQLRDRVHRMGPLGDTPLSRAEPRGCRPRGSRPLPRPASHSLRSRRSWA